MRSGRGGSPGRAPQRRFPGDDGPEAYERPRAPRLPEPPVPEEVTGQELDREVRAQLRGLTKDNASAVARHLVAVAELLDVDPARALEHAQAAQRRAGRIGVVREAAGIAAYRAGQYAEALRELRAARRITGSSEHLPLMADAERGLGRPERALALAAAPEAAELDQAGRVEMLVVASGARRDLGDAEAAVVALQVPELEGPQQPWSARLWYAYGDALLAAGREDRARSWLERAAAADPDGETDAAERLAELDGVAFLEEPDDEPDDQPDDEPEGEPDDASDDGPDVEDGSARDA